MSSEHLLQLYSWSDEDYKKLIMFMYKSDTEIGIGAKFRLLQQKGDNMEIVGMFCLATGNKRPHQTRVH